MSPDQIGALAQHILDTHHALLHAELPRLSAALRAAPGPVRGPWFALAQLLEEHLIKEERILFPIILSLAAGQGSGGCGVSGPIRQMGHEHDQIRALEEELRQNLALAGAEAGALGRLLDDLHLHAEKEDDALFPAAVGLEQGEEAEEAYREEAYREEARQAERAAQASGQAGPPLVTPRAAARQPPAPPPKRGLIGRLLGRLRG
jgi:iron-sulfur cluster repair protein YtfE (RIC family)